MFAFLYVCRVNYSPSYAGVYTIDVKLNIDTPTSIGDSPFDVVFSALPPPLITQAKLSDSLGEVVVSFSMKTDQVYLSLTL